MLDGQSSCGWQINIHWHTQHLRYRPIFCLSCYVHHTQKRLIKDRHKTTYLYIKTLCKWTNIWQNFILSSNFCLLVSAVFALELLSPTSDKSFSFNPYSKVDQGRFCPSLICCWVNTFTFTEDHVTFCKSFYAKLQKVFTRKSRWFSEPLPKQGGGCIWPPRL